MISAILILRSIRESKEDISAAIACCFFVAVVVVGIAVLFGGSSE